MIKKNSIYEVADIKNKIWQALDILRNDKNFNGTEDYHFLLLLLILQKEGALNEFDFSGDLDFKKEIYLAFIRLDSLDTETIKALLLAYRPVISKLNNEIIENLVRFSRGLNQNILKNNFPEIFDDLLYKLSKINGRNAGESLLPIEISRFVCALAELPRKAKVYNPFAGSASFAVFFNEGQSYVGQENNLTTWAIGYLRILAHQRNGVTDFKNGDSIREWNPTVDQITGNPQKFDLIVSNPPLGSRLKGDFGFIQSSEHFIIEKGIKELTSDGKLIVIVSLRFLFDSSAEQNIRHYLIHQDLIETVILLPGGLLPNTSLSIAILVINKKKKDKGVVKFIDAKYCIVKISPKEKQLDEKLLMQVYRSHEANDAVRIVPNEIIVRNNYNLLVPRYFMKSFEGVQLLELLNPVVRNNSRGNEKGKFVQIRDLRVDKFNYTLDLSSFEIVKINLLSQVIVESCLLIASIGGKLKATYFHYTGESIYIHRNVYAFKVNEDIIDIDYLINELYADNTKEQLASLFTGAVMASLRKEDFLSIKIELPSKAEQRAKVKGVLESLAEEKKQELAAFNKIHGLENALLEQNAYLRHSLAGASTNLKGAFKSIKKIIEDQVEPLVPGIMHFKETPSHVLEFKKLMEILQVNVDKITQTTSRVTNTSNPVEGIQLYPVEIFDFLETYCKQKNGIGNLPYSLVFQYDAGAFVDENAEIINTYILANKDLLTDLLDNVIQNAKQHAFPGYSNNRIEIYLMTNSDDNVNSDITFLVSNTGKRFPEDFTLSDFTRSGSTAGDNGGDGYGGWLINQIIKYFKGTMDIIKRGIREIKWRGCR
jgi:type I restriction enzyme M protein